MVLFETLQSGTIDNYVEDVPASCMESFLLFCLFIAQSSTVQRTTPEGCTTYISGTGTCHREGYLFSRYWYKERYQFSQFGYKERYLFSRFLDEIYKVGYTFSKNWYKEWVCF